MRGFMTGSFYVKGRRKTSPLRTRFNTRMRLLYGYVNIYFRLRENDQAAGGVAMIDDSGSRLWRIAATRIRTDLFAARSTPLINTDRPTASGVI